eukprot:CAMPEP_0184673058 /NCGR_PEP_ID=MMETSP0308-20130426/86457_1 /TAXON_ID=38269 /ORGANISM="Gloeochaete witrockiana, Strain SAG 46.84" /LENGTH=260 /DNA_ID=CAMNT_0027120497 /DNA_START=526 /DNA_END=1308 /DNA_ORIENTATION=-
MNLKDMPRSALPSAVVHSVEILDLEEDMPSTPGMVADRVKHYEARTADALGEPVVQDAYPRIDYSSDRATTPLTEEDEDLSPHSTSTRNPRSAGSYISSSASSGSSARGGGITSLGRIQTKSSVFPHDAPEQRSGKKGEALFIRRPTSTSTKVVSGKQSPPPPPPPNTSSPGLSKTMQLGFAKLSQRFSYASDEDIFSALHLAKGDVARATRFLIDSGESSNESSINFILDTAASAPADVTVEETYSTSVYAASSGRRRK